MIVRAQSTNRYLTVQSPYAYAATGQGYSSQALQSQAAYMNSPRQQVTAEEPSLWDRFKPWLALIAAIGVTALGTLYFKGRTIHLEELGAEIKKTNPNGIADAITHLNNSDSQEFRDNKVKEYTQQITAKIEELKNATGDTKTKIEKEIIRLTNLAEAHEAPIVFEGKGNQKQVCVRFATQKNGDEPLLTVQNSKGKMAVTENSTPDNAHLPFIQNGRISSFQAKEDSTYLGSPMHVNGKGEVTQLAIHPWETVTQHGWDRVKRGWNVFFDRKA